VHKNWFTPRAVGSAEFSAWNFYSNMLNRCQQLSALKVFKNIEFWSSDI